MSYSAERQEIQKQAGILTLIPQALLIEACQLDRHFLEISYIHTGRKSAGDKTPTDCPRLPEPRSVVICSFTTIRPTSVGNVIFNVLYKEEWTKPFPAQNIDLKKKFTEFGWLKLSYPNFENESLAAAKTFQTFSLLPDFLIKVITPRVSGNAWGLLSTDKLE